MFGFSFLRARLGEAVAGSKYLHRIAKPGGKGFTYVYSETEFEQKYGILKNENFRRRFGFHLTPAGLDALLDRVFKAGGKSEKLKISFAAWRAHFNEYWRRSDHFNRLYGPGAPATLVEPAQRARGARMRADVLKHLVEVYGRQQPIGKPEPANREGSENVTGPLPETHNVRRGLDSPQPAESQPGPPGRSGSGALADGFRSGRRSALTPGRIREIRREVVELLEKKPPPIAGSVGRDHDQFTGAELELLKTYEGAGGTGESAGAGQTLYSFYTPEPVVAKMWELARAYIKPGADVLDPAAGSGRFAALGGEYTIDQIEPDGLAARINQILNPETTVMRGVFQDLFRDPERNREAPYSGKAYDLVIGNPPYGTYSGRDSEIIGREHKRYESLFIERGLDTLKPGGVMVMLVPRGFMDHPDPAILEKIAAKGKLQAAYRLPNGIFPTTDVGTDIVVIRKEPGSPADFQQYFERYPDRVLGTWSKTKTDRFGRPLLGGTLKELARIKPGTVQPAPFGVLDADRGGALKGNQNARGHRGRTGKRQGAQVDANIVSAPVKIISFNEFNAKYNSHYSEADRETLKHTRFDGSFDPEKVEFQPSLHSVHRGKYFHDALYASGNIYNKLEDLERERAFITGGHGQGQYEKQRALLENALPKPKGIDEYHLSPISAFVQETFKFEDGRTLVDEFLEWAGVRTYGYGVDWANANVSRQELGSSIAWQDIVAYLRRTPVRGLTSDDVSIRKEARRIQTRRREAAENLFRRFLTEGLDGEKKQKLELACNRTFNAVVDPDFDRIPVAIDGLATVFKGKPVEVKEHQLRAVKFLNIKGSGVIAYGTGLGKTFPGLMATVQNLQMGRCKRPLIVVPRAVYSKWVRETRSRFPNIPVNELGNLGAGSNFDPGTGIPENSISIMTYEGLQALSYSPEVLQDLTGDLDDALSTGGLVRQTQFESAREREKIAALAGRGQKGARRSFDVETIGFDHVSVDESHNFKNLIEKARARKNRGKEANEFADITGATSDRAARLFLLTQFIQGRNNGRNVFLLSATPFTNSPIEIYSMLQYVARDELRAMGLSNVNEFLSAFAELKNDWVVKPGGNVVRKDVVKSFKNVTALQDLIRRNMDFMNAQDLGGKIDIPEKRTHVVKLGPTAIQKELLGAGEKIIAANKKPGDALRGIALMRQVTLSPGQAMGGQPFVESSPKLSFACGVVANIYKERRDVGHILYIPEGVEHFKEVQEYFVKQGVPRGAVRVIEGGTKLEIRDEIKNSFNDPEGEVKILIGTRAIMEGVSLNGCTATTFDLHLPWNPSEKIQLEGRAWRQGNRLERTHMLTPVLLDSADSAMLQKHDEKGARFNDLMSYRGGSTMSVEGISADELKFELIKNPEKLAGWKMARETENQEAEAGALKAAAENMRIWARQYDSVVEDIESERGNIEQYKNSLQNVSKEVRKLKERGDTGYALDRAEETLLRYRNLVKKAKESLEKNERTRRLILTNAQGRGIQIADLIQEAEKLEQQAEQMTQKVKTIRENREYYIAEAKKQIEARSEQAPDLEEQINKYSRLLIDDINAQKMKQKSFFQRFMERLAA